MENRTRDGVRSFVPVRRVVWKVQVTGKEGDDLGEAAGLGGSMCVAAMAMAIRVAVDDSRWALMEVGRADCMPAKHAKPPVSAAKRPPYVRYPTPDPHLKLNGIRCKMANIHPRRLWKRKRCLQANPESTHPTAWTSLQQGCTRIDPSPLCSSASMLRGRAKRRRRVTVSRSSAFV